jgi:A1 cistron-splicing factor AAR2
MDSFLVPFPVDDTTALWSSLTHCIEPHHLSTWLPTTQASLHLLSTMTPSNLSPVLDLPPSLDMNDMLYFTRINVKRSFPSGASGDELSKHSLDKSWLLTSTLSECYQSSTSYTLI